MAREEPRFLAIGRIVKPHGVRGEVVVHIITDFPERFETLREVYIGEEAPRRVQVERARFHQGRVVLKLSGYEDRTAAEELRGEFLMIPVEEAMPLEPDEYYEHQIIGLQVWTTEGVYLGEVTEILRTGANDVYVVRSAEREILLPAIGEVIRQVDLERERMLVELMEGLV